MKNSEQTTEIFNQYRTLLFAIAYRMLGSATDAEDIVQEAFIRWLQASEEDVQSPKAYLSTIVVRLCIDQQRSARVQREVYAGPWLPEPILTDQQYEMVDPVLHTESLSFAFLVMLERLGPLERAILLLREVFEYDYAEIAQIVGRNEANCRQILRRAHQHLGKDTARFRVSREEQERITDLFLQASTNGDMQGLLHLLADDVVYTGDSNGKAKAGLRPVYGVNRVLRGMMAAERSFPPGFIFRKAEVNGQPAILGEVDGAPYMAILLDVENDRVRHIYVTLNPDKLHWLRRRT